VEGLHPESLCKKLTDAGIYCTSGNHYCTFWDKHYGASGLNDADGVTRIGFLHYNTMEDVKRVLGTLEKISR
jgi:selenocysteine lyase/cysteine desulfurase